MSTNPSSTSNSNRIDRVDISALSRLNQPNTLVFKPIQRAPEMSVQQYLLSITTTWDKHISEGPAMSKLPIGGSHPCFIIAEIGQNHQGDINIAKDLIRHAKEAGANCVKFQKSSLRDRFTKDALEAPYDGPNSFGKTYGEHRARLEFSDDEIRELQRYAEEIAKVMFTASPMDIESSQLVLTDAILRHHRQPGHSDSNHQVQLEEQWLILYARTNNLIRSLDSPSSSILLFKPSQRNSDI